MLQSRCHWAGPFPKCLAPYNFHHFCHVGVCNNVVTICSDNPFPKTIIVLSIERLPERDLCAKRYREAMALRSLTAAASRTFARRLSTASEQAAMARGSQLPLGNDPAAFHPVEHAISTFALLVLFALFISSERLPLIISVDFSRIGMRDMC